MKLGSLFDGSGGFPLAGAINGIIPAWASEIEPYPIRVTKARFPQMKHLGSVLDVNGAEVEPVDIITFGSPCQDLSVAGKQAGLHKGERSNLFFEAIRIIKEMREATNGKHPRIAVWENVPGAYSSNKGEDFRAVLQAFCSVKDEAADVPRPASGKWNPAGAIVGNGWSIAWRTFDAQFWGVPQRRKRIYLVADFGSERAGEVLFEQNRLPGDSAPSGTAREGTSDNAEGSAGGSCVGFDHNTSMRNGMFAFDERANTLRVGGAGGGVCYPIVFKERAGCPGGGKGILCGDKPFTLSTMTDQAVCYAVRTAQTNANGIGVAQDAHTLDGANAQAVCFQACGDRDNPNISVSDTAYCIPANPMSDRGQAVCYPIDSHQQDSRFRVCDDGISPTLPGQMGTGGNNGPMLIETAKPPRRYIIRRLTPLECCRLQGFPDWWEDGVQGSDSARYKMWGNGIALPNAAHVVGCAVRLIEARVQDE